MTFESNASFSFDAMFDAQADAGSGSTAPVAQQAATTASLYQSASRIAAGQFNPLRISSLAKKPISLTQSLARSKASDPGAQAAPILPALLGTRSSMSTGVVVAGVGLLALGALALLARRKKNPRRRR